MTSAKISVAIGVGAAAIIALQAHQVSVQKQNVKQLQEQLARAAQPAPANPDTPAEMEKLRTQNAADSKTIEGLQRDLAQARARASAALAAKPAPAPRPAAVTAAGAGGDFFAMFSDPSMLEAMRPQQLATTKMMYRSSGQTAQSHPGTGGQVLQPNR